MRTYEVDRPVAPQVRAMALAAGVVLVAGALASSYRPFLVYEVEVDGRPFPVRAQSTVGDVVASGGAGSRAGDLVAADDGSVVVPGGGEPALVEREGHPAGASEPVAPGDRLTSRTGADVVESTVVTETAVEPPVLEVGSGAFANVVEPGEPGRALVRVGAVSGHEVSRTVLAQPRPGRVVRSNGSGGLKVAALTFDDGPWPGGTEPVLQILAKEEVHATFFVLGANVSRYPALARRIVDEGHNLGNHTWSHRTNRGTPADLARREIGGTQKVIREFVGVEARWFRPPGGMMSPHMLAEVRAQGLSPVWWTVDPWDWSRPGEGPIAKRVVAATKPGAVILLHDGGGDRAQTVRALPSVITLLKRQGYTFVTMDELAKIRAAAARR